MCSLLEETILRRWSQVKLLEEGASLAQARRRPATHGYLDRLGRAGAPTLMF